MYIYGELLLTYMLLLLFFFFFFFFYMFSNLDCFMLINYTYVNTCVHL